MQVHVTRKRVLGAAIVLGTTIVLTQGAFTFFGEPAHAEEGTEAAIETQRRGFAGPGARAGPGRAGLPLRRLDLSEAQQEQIDELRAEAREAAATTRDEMREARRELRGAMQSEALDEGRIRSLASTVASLQADALVRGARVYTDILQVLTSEQRERVSALQERRQERLGERREERRERFRNRRR